MGEYYSVTEERGQTVLVIASGAGAWTDAVGWKTPQLARQYAKTKFGNLQYREDI